MWDIYIKRWMRFAFWWVPGIGSTSQPHQDPDSPDNPPGPTERASPKPESPDSKTDPLSDRKTTVAADQASAPDQATAPASDSAPTKAPDDRDTGEKPEKPASAQTSSGTDEAATSDGDDLTAIKGVGPAVQKALEDAGVRSFKDLAKAEPEVLLEKVKSAQPTVSKARVESWIKGAQEQLPPSKKGGAGR